MRVTVPFMNQNCEARARAICASDLAFIPVKVPGEILVAVDRYWPVVAHEIDGGIFNPTAKPLPLDLEKLAAEYRTLLLREGAPYLVRENRALMIGRIRRLTELWPRHRRDRMME
ncbi:MAG TPA: hypothetical protein VIQ29_04190 [Ancylobacter sp.]